RVEQLAFHIRASFWRHSPAPAFATVALACSAFSPVLLVRIEEAHQARLQVAAPSCPQPNSAPRPDRGEWYRMGEVRRAICSRIDRPCDAGGQSGAVASRGG